MAPDPRMFLFKSNAYFYLDSIVGKKSGPGVYISEVVKGGAADLDGRLVQVNNQLGQIDDQIGEVNNLFVTIRYFFFYCN